MSSEEEKEDDLFDEMGGTANIKLSTGSGDEDDSKTNSTTHNTSNTNEQDQDGKANKEIIEMTNKSDKEEHNTQLEEALQDNVIITENMALDKQEKEVQKEVNNVEEVEQEMQAETQMKETEVHPSSPLPATLATQSELQFKKVNSKSKNRRF